MRQGRKAKRWSFVLVLSFFLFFHQLDVLLLRPITVEMLSVLNVSDIWIEPMIIISVIVSIICALIWGYLFDRHSRVKILALVSFIFGATSWLKGISPTLATYLISSAAGGMDNISASGIFALVGDYFGAKNRGKIFGLFLVSQPMALLTLIIFSTALLNAINWRLLLLVMGMIGLIFSLLIYLSQHEPKRGSQERGMTDVSIVGIYKIDWELVSENIKAPSLLLIFIFCFLGSVPWNILTIWISPHFQEINQVTSLVVAQRLLPALFALMIGLPVGGLLGDLYARKHDEGRVIIAILGMVLPPVFLLIAFLINDLTNPYAEMLFILMGFFMAFSWPNVLPLIFAITIPEVRSFTTSIGLALQAMGGLIGAYLVSVMQVRFGLGSAILWVTIGAWLLGCLSLCGLFVTFPRDNELFRRHMAYRSHLERRLNQSKPRHEA
jgi:MFS transporter, Spinster family, sphingosine-1-phosphate transporter